MSLPRHPSESWDLPSFRIVGRSLIAGFLVLALAGPAAGSVREPPRTAEPNWDRAVRIDIPDDLAPAILPYMMCLTEPMNRRSGARMGGDRRSPDALRTDAEIVAACGEVRQGAVQGADQLLRRNGEDDAGARGARIEAALSGLENHIVRLNADARETPR